MFPKKRGEGQRVINEYIRLYGKRLYGFCCTLCANSIDADDLYQETWLRLVTNLHRYDTSKPFEPYLTGICVNAYRDVLRRKKRSPIFDSFATTEEKESVMESVSAEETKDYSELHEAVARLPEKMRVTILLFYFHDMEISRVAVALRVPEGTVKSRLHQAKKLLRKELSDGTDLQF